MVEPLSREEFLDEKRDFSPLLVHLTKDDDANMMYAKDALDMILDQKTLKAFNHFCLFDSDLEKLRDVSLREKFKVVCFTETPIDQINVLLTEVSGRNFKPKPYGLVFKKEYIRQQKGNPVFYVSGNLFDSLWQLYNDAKERSFSLNDNRVLALVNRCDEIVDFHWEREWRIIGDLKFRLDDIYCGLCPKEEIPNFESKYGLKFIDPRWGINRILDKLVNLSKER